MNFHYLIKGLKNILYKFYVGVMYEKQVLEKLKRSFSIFFKFSTFSHKSTAHITYVHCTVLYTFTVVLLYAQWDTYAIQWLFCCSIEHINVYRTCAVYSYRWLKQKDSV